MKRRHRGLGSQQKQLQLESEKKIIDCLSSFNYSNTWGNIRSLSRQTKMHHSTVRKAINRLKKNTQVIEIKGNKNASLFCLLNSPLIDNVRNRIKEDYWCWKTRFHRLNNTKEIKKRLRRTPEEEAQLAKAKAELEVIKEEIKEYVRKQNE